MAKKIPHFEKHTLTIKQIKSGFIWHIGIQSSSVEDLCSKEEVISRIMHVWYNVIRKCNTMQEQAV